MAINDRNHQFAHKELGLTIKHGLVSLCFFMSIFQSRWRYPMRSNNNMCSIILGYIIHCFTGLRHKQQYLWMEDGSCWLTMCDNLKTMILFGSWVRGRAMATLTHWNPCLVPVDLQVVYWQTGTGLWCLFHIYTKKCQHIK